MSMTSYWKNLISELFARYHQPHPPNLTSYYRTFASPGIQKKNTAI